jgi:hypothetical protein
MWDLNSHSSDTPFKVLDSPVHRPYSLPESCMAIRNVNGLPMIIRFSFSFCFGNNKSGGTGRCGKGGFRHARLKYASFLVFFFKGLELVEMVTFY